MKKFKQMHKQAKGAYSLEVLAAGTVLLYPNRFKLVLQWLAAIPTLKPLCFTCEVCWDGDFNHSPPAAFVFMTPFAAPPPVLCSVSGLCLECAIHPEREARIMDRIREVMPEATMMKNTSQ